MVSFAIKHLEQDSSQATRRVMVSRTKGSSSGKVKPSRKYYQLRYSYLVHPENGSANSTVDALFPSGKYAYLSNEPSWSGHRFIGWFQSASTPSAAIPSTAGAIQPSDSVVYSMTDIYARWQTPTTITFDATTNGGQMPSGWTAPYYYAGQSYGDLPTPTHASLNFTGWYDGSGNKVVSVDVVPAGGATLTARYSASSFSVDLNNEWRLQDPNTNPDTSEYAGVYESFSNYNYEDQETWTGSMAKMYIDVVGYTNFKIYIRSWAESSYDYTVAMEPDYDPSDVPYVDPWGGESSEGIKAHTCNAQNDDTSISGYTEVNYELDGGSHRICVVYRKDSSYSEYDDRGYVLIPYQQ